MEDLCFLVERKALRPDLWGVDSRLLLYCYKLPILYQVVSLGVEVIEGRAGCSLTWCNSSQILCPVTQCTQISIPLCTYYRRYTFEAAVSYGVMVDLAICVI